MVRQKTHTTKKVAAKKVTTKVQTRAQVAAKQPTAYEDFKNAALLVSVTINVAFFVGWLALQITTQYDEQIAYLLFSR